MGVVMPGDHRLFHLQPSKLTTRSIFGRWEQVGTCFQGGGALIQSFDTINMQGNCAARRFWLEKESSRYCSGIRTCAINTEVSLEGYL